MRSLKVNRGVIYSFAVLLIILVFLLISIMSCGGGGAGLTDGRIHVSLIGDWPNNSFCAELLKRVILEPLSDKLPVLINASALSTMDAQTREDVRNIYTAGRPIVLLSADQTQIDELVNMVGKKEKVKFATLKDNPTSTAPAIGIDSDPGCPASYQLLTSSSDIAAVKREVDGFLSWLLADNMRRRPRTSSINASNGTDLRELAELPQATQQWSGNIAFYQLTTTAQTLYSHANNAYYTGCTVELNGNTSINPYAFKVAALAGWAGVATVDNWSDFADIILHEPLPASVQSTTSYTTGFSVSFSGGVTFNAVGPGITYTEGGTWSESTTVAVPNITIFNTSSYPFTGPMILSPSPLIEVGGPMYQVEWDLHDNVSSFNFNGSWYAVYTLQPSVQKPFQVDTSIFVLGKEVISNPGSPIEIVTKDVMLGGLTTTVDF